jgi:flagellar motor switch protein FliM
MSSNNDLTSESLSQDEADLLLADSEDESTFSANPQSGSGVKVYDFRRPSRISKDRGRSLEAIYGLLAKSVEGWLTGRVRDHVSLELQSVEELTFGEFMTSLPSPCASFIMDIDGSGGQQGVIDFGHEFAFFIVDRLLGGSGEPAIPERPLTPTERLLVRLVADRAAQQLSEAWQDSVKMDLNITGFETIPEMLQVANREDPVLVANINVTMGDMSSPLLICLPFSVLEKFFTTSTVRKVQVAQGTEEERIEEKKYLEGSIRSARIPIQARFRETLLTLRQLAELKEGSILQTDLRTDAELFVFVAGQRRFSGIPGRVGKNLAARLEDAVEIEPADLIQPGRQGFEL